MGAGLFRIEVGHNLLRPDHAAPVEWARHPGGAGISRPGRSALLADWPEENLRKAKETGSLLEPAEIADAVIYMLSRPRNVTIRDMIVLPTNFDI